ncbi:bile acid:sodium symporter family protein [Chryseolinea lacunae]|uniref:Bile acid:sodium symporter n=1 Tax=Chryseolinea lacunae TaxID=2801331 RepID=A0ABS1KN91_9BACT|nr:bile acid:sodium symporter family protein [Chryseolinea lacunae]MBL0740924.1 bile acid:sodium symporter [Chryseolinea lacunae]
MSRISFSLKSTLQKVGLDGFIITLLSLILLAYVWPQPGLMEKPVSLGELANYGLSLVFFFYGLRLSPRALRDGLSNWRLHLLVQAGTFVLFPLLVLAAKPFVSSDAGLLWLGTFYLAALPSTVSSSVVMVSMARGNIPAAIFNASVSSLAGVFITPLWMALFLTADVSGLDTTDIILKLALQVLAPVLVGILLHGYGGDFALKYKKQLRYFDQSVILAIVYTSFCHSFAGHVFDQLSVVQLLLMGVCLAALFFVAYFCLSFVAKVAGLGREERITLLFCGSKKSIVHGTVMSKVLFQQAATAGILLLPIMMYHALQLIFVSLIAQRMARDVAPVTTAEK